MEQSNALAQRFWWACMVNQLELEMWFIDGWTLMDTLLYPFMFVITNP